MNAQFNAKPLYDIYTVSIKLRERLYGGTPKNKELIEAWIKARTQKNDELTEQQIEAAQEVMSDELEDRSWMGFQRDENGLFIAANNVKAMLKQGASMLGILKRKKGTKQIMCEGMEVKSIDKEGSRIYLGKQEPDGDEEKPIHVVGRQGPRTALKRADYVEALEISFFIWVLGTAASETRHVGQKELVQILTFSQENGLGADRSQGAGKFDVLSFEQVQKAKRSKEEEEEEEAAAGQVKAKPAKKPAKKAKGNGAEKSAQQD